MGQPREPTADARTPAILYCDESGNTGSNYNDLDQPFYVLASLIVTDGDAQPLEGFIHDLRRDGAVQSPEVKAGALIKTSRGRHALGGFLAKLMDPRFAVFVSVYEKRFGICARIVDDCLDGVYNSRVDIGLLEDPGRKQQISNRLYERLADETLRWWADAWRKGDRSQLVSATRDLCATLTRGGEKDLAFRIEGALEKIEKWVHRASAPESVNLPAWIDLIMRVEYFCEAAGLGPVTIVHDEIPQFEATYREALRQSQQGRHRIHVGPHGAPWVDGVRRLTTYRSESSKSCLLLQVADAVASSIGGLLKEGSASGSIEPILEPIDAFIRYLATISSFVIGVKHLNLIVAESKVAVIANVPRAGARPLRGRK